MGVDKMISGSRPGDTAVMWQARLYQFDWVEELARCKRNCKFLVERLAELGVSTSFQSLNVVTPKPSEDLTRKYQLMPYDDNCQCVVLPHVTQDQLAVFVEEYGAELRAGAVQKTTALLRELAASTPSLSASEPSGDVSAGCFPCELRVGFSFVVVQQGRAFACCGHCTDRGQNASVPASRCCGGPRYSSRGV